MRLERPAAGRLELPGRRAPPRRPCGRRALALRHRRFAGVLWARCDVAAARSFLLARRSTTNTGRAPMRSSCWAWSVAGWARREFGVQPSAGLGPLTAPISRSP